MREILFRGKRIDNYVNDKSIDYTETGVGEWAYGAIIHRRYYKNKYVIVIRTEDSGFDNYSDYEVDPLTVGQYTGLTANGKKIFEGDIIRANHDGAIGIVRFGEYMSPSDPGNTRHIGYYVDWQGKEKDFLRADLGYWASRSDVKVIGNIHDNPELLEDKS